MSTPGVLIPALTGGGGALAGILSVFVARGRNRIDAEHELIEILRAELNQARAERDTESERLRGKMTDLRAELARMEDRLRHVEAENDHLRRTTLKRSTDRLSGGQL